jgi:choice-of-anchor B domain-containing protein
LSKTFRSVLFLLFTGYVCFAQLANQNTYLLSQKDEHGSGYSACWGYRAPDNREYAILGCNSGTAFIDITDTTNIHEVDFITGITSGWREMKVFSHYAYVVSEGTNSRLQIMDLQYLPDSVSLVNTYSYTNYTKTHTISQSGPYLYLNGGNVTFGGSNQGGLTVLDITNPVNPVKRGSWSQQYVHDARIIDDTIYACNIYNSPQGTASIYVINAGNKDNLTNVTSWVNGQNPFPHNCALTTDKRYIYTTDETSSPNGKLKIWDRQNLNNVIFVTSWQPTGITTAIVHNVEIYNNIAVIAHYTAGMRILDISNPVSPQEIAWYDTYPSSNSANFSGCWGIFMFPSGKIIGSDISGGLFVIKSTLNLVGLGNHNSSLPGEFKLKQNYPNPFNPSTTIEYSIPEPSHVSIKVFDVLGKAVALVTDEFRQAGNYRVNYDAGALSSGVYFYTLSAGGFKQTKRMTLVK